MQSTADNAAPAVQPMEGHGAYNRSSRVQAAGLLPAVALFEQAARDVALSPETIVIADYGASEGRNSMLPVSAAIAALRDRVGRDRAVSVVHTDLPGNDFTALFQTLDTDPDSYLHGDPKAYPFAVGRSFYEQLLPSGSVTLGWSSWAVQWLSRVPAIIPDQVQVAYSRDPAARAAFGRQAAEDWRSFLTHRSAEMRDGGRLVILTMASDAAGGFGYQPLLEFMHAALREMVDQGFLRAAELQRMAIPTVGRSEAEFGAPFAADGHFVGLRMEHLDVFEAEDRIWAAFEADGDAHAFGATWAAFSRASVFPSMAAALEGGARDPRRPAFMDLLEAGLAARLSRAPSRMRIPLAKLLLVKSGGAAE